MSAVMPHDRNTSAVMPYGDVSAVTPHDCDASAVTPHDHNVSIIMPHDRDATAASACYTTYCCAPECVAYVELLYVYNSEKIYIFIESYWL
jgi:hypothetical protein